jgi:Xaa-Pro aminopeptidase
MNYQARMLALRAKMEAAGIDAFFLKSDANYFYLTGFTGSSGALLITQDDIKLFTDSRYTTQSKEQTSASGVEIIIHKQPLLDEVAHAFKGLREAKIGYEADNLLVSELHTLEDATTSYTLVPFMAFVEEIRYIKDEAELTILKKAAGIGEQVLTDALNFIKPGIREIDVAMRMEGKMRELGASGSSFDTIVASGIRGALPHGMASEKIIQAGELVTIDFGVKYGGYCSDMTRTISVGEPANQQLVEIYDIVLAANLAGIAALKAGLTGFEVDVAARQIIDVAGYGPAFGHGLGHALGIEVHENPRLSPTSDTVLAPHMVVTVEPGIYIEGLGGVRIEDTLAITTDGSDNFMTLPKELIVV